MRRNARQEVSDVPRGRPAPPGAQDPPHGRFADLVAEPAQFAVHSAVSPGRVLPRQPQHQVADLLAGPRAAWPVGIRPLAFDQAAVPGQQRARCDEPVGAQHGRQQPGQRRQDRPVGPVRLRPGDLTPEHRDLMTEHHDLRILGRLAAAQQQQPAEDPDHDQVEQAKRHKPRSCPNTAHPAKPQVTASASSSEAVRAESDYAEDLRRALDVLRAEGLVLFVCPDRTCSRPRPHPPLRQGRCSSALTAPR